MAKKEAVKETLLLLLSRLPELGYAEVNLGEAVASKIRSL
jgi:hypothetical protein